MPRKPKHTIAELEAALEYFRSLTPGSSAAIYYEIIDRIVQNAINQRRASKDNPGRPPIKTGKYDKVFEPKERKHD